MKQVIFQTTLHPIIFLDVIVLLVLSLSSGLFFSCYPIDPQHRPAITDFEKDGSISFFYVQFLLRHDRTSRVAFILSRIYTYWLIFSILLCEEELESTVAELEASNRSLAILKAENDATKGAFFPVLNLTNRALGNDKARDKNKELRDLESALKELLVIPPHCFHCGWCLRSFSSYIGSFDINRISHLLTYGNSSIWMMKEYSYWSNYAVCRF